MMGKTILPIMISVTLLTFAITTTFTIGHVSAIKITKPVVGGSKIVKGGTGPTVVAKDCMYGGVAYSKGAVIQQADGKNYECSGDDDGAWVKKS